MKFLALESLSSRTACRVDFTFRHAFFQFIGGEKIFSHLIMLETSRNNRKYTSLAQRPDLNIIIE